MRRNASAFAAVAVLGLGTAAASSGDEIPTSPRAFHLPAMPATPTVQEPQISMYGYIIIARGAQVNGASGGAMLVNPFAYRPYFYPARSDYAATYSNDYSREYGRRPSPGEEAEKGVAEKVLVPSRSRHDVSRAQKLIARGDESFAKGSYTVAIARYREAAQVAPDAFDARLRHALALVAARKYAAAARVFFEAADLRSDWARTHVDLESLYGPGRLPAATAALVRSADRDATNGELALSAGLQLYFSGQYKVAVRYFQRATQLGADKYSRLAEVIKHAEQQSGE